MLCTLPRFSGVSYKGWAHAAIFSPQINGVLPASPLPPSPWWEGVQPARPGSFGVQAAKVSLLLHQAGYLV